MEITILLILGFTSAVNFIGVLAPELSFDALWYHLTLPKIYLMEKAIRFIPGGLLYYSAMPRLGEMFYLFSLWIADERLAKFIHFSFGLMAAFFTFKIARLFVNKKFSLLAALIFYSTLVVGWLSTTAYIDLIRTGFETIALYYFLVWIKKENLKSLLISALFLGLAISTKLLAFESLIIFLILILFKINFKGKLKSVFQLSAFSLFSLLPVIPWLVMAFISTGNPIYPIGSKILDNNHLITNFSLIGFFNDFWQLILKPQDPISSIFLIVLPLIIIRVYKLIKEKNSSNTLEISLYFYSFLAYFIWYFIPRTGGGRFILPYLPAWSVVTALVIGQSDKLIKRFLVYLVIVISLLHLGYRFLANKKYLPFIFGKQSKAEFLCSNLNFTTNAFYDCDGYFKKNIKKTDQVLIYCSHNLFYVDFPFIHESWRRNADKFNYVMTQNCTIPEEFNNLPLIYKNKKTGVELWLYNKLPD